MNMYMNVMLVCEKFLMGLNDYIFVMRSSWSIDLLMFYLLHNIEKESHTQKQAWRGHSM